MFTGYKRQGHVVYRLLNIKQLQHSYRARYDVIEFSNCRTEERSETAK